MYIYIIYIHRHIYRERERDIYIYIHKARWALKADGDYGVDCRPRGHIDEGFSEGAVEGSLIRRKETE